MSKEPSRLVLFDIDGTLLHGGPLWKECFLGALAHYYPNLRFPKVAFGGKTDLQICRELMEKAGFEDAVISRSLREIVDLYVQKAAHQLVHRAHEVQVLPGVFELLDALKEDSRIIVGLLTGNVKPGADLKLGAAGLRDYFRFGVFCDDHHDRYHMPSLALSRAQQLYGLSFSGKQVVIIGDTIHDVNCGKSIGVRSIAVGTGYNVPTDDLLSQNPDYYFKDLSATHEVWQAIVEEL
jgi:phosphoglycolate phosphatase-like HAD superfamily hydrolase